MSSSEQEAIYRFNSTDDPLVSIPSAISSSVQSSELEEPQLGTDNDFVFRIPNTPIDLVVAPVTPNKFGSTFSQASEESEYASPAVAARRGKRRVHKVNSGRFQKGIKRKHTFTLSTNKRLPNRNLSYSSM